MREVGVRWSEVPKKEGRMEIRERQGGGERKSGKEWEGGMSNEG